MERLHFGFMSAQARGDDLNKLIRDLEREIK
jgi:hypothetical protein